MTGAFGRLGLPDDASSDDVRAARRELAKRHHPDAGGQAASMRDINEAAAAALRTIEQRSDHTTQSPHPGPGNRPDAASTAPSGNVGWSRVESDVPSFTIEALPAEAFEALLAVAPDFAEVLDDDPPYRLETVLHAPLLAWCRLELVPDAGSSTASITIASIDGHPLPPVERVRDLWVARLNRLEW